MKRDIKNLIGYSIHATDGEIGRVEEFYFDDETWTIRYLIVKMGGWLSGRKVLISPQALLTPDWENRQFPVNLSKEQIRNSPDIDTDKPVSRQQEEQLHKHYPWQGYWGNGFYSGGLWGIIPANPVVEEIPEHGREDQLHGDTHLRSTNSVIGYSIHATDGEIGEVTDYVMDDANWKLKFFVIRTGSWMNPRNVLLSTKWIKEVQWANSMMVADISAEQVKNGPAFDLADYISDVYEQRLFDHYGKPVEKHQREFNLK